MHLRFFTVFLLFATVSLAQQVQRDVFVGIYVYMVPGGTDTLHLAPSGIYSLITEGEAGRTSRVTAREQGRWKFDGWAVILEPDPASEKTEQKNGWVGRRLFPVEDIDGSRFLVSPLRKQKGSDEYFFHPMFKKEPNQALQHNDPSCHVSCLRTPRASRDRG